MLQLNTPKALWTRFAHSRIGLAGAAKILALAGIWSVAPSRAFAEDIPAPTCNFLPSALCVDTVDGFVSAVINWAFGLIAGVMVIMIVVAGIQMASAADSPDRLKAAKGRAINAVIALFCLVFFRAILSLLELV